jgi:hypothetical protein
MGYSKFATKSWKSLWGKFGQIVKHKFVPNFLREFSVVSRNKVHRYMRCIKYI